METLRNHTRKERSKRKPRATGRIVVVRAPDGTQNEDRTERAAENYAKIEEACQRAEAFLLHTSLCLCREKTERRRRASATPLETQSALERPSRGSVYAEGVSQVHHKSRGATVTGNRKILDHLLRSNRKYQGSGLSAHQFVVAVFF